MIGVPSGVIGRKPVQKVALAWIARAAEQILDRMHQRLATLFAQGQVKARNLGHATGADGRPDG